ISNGNSYHPPGENAPGEKYLKDLYDRLTANPAVWEKTLLIVSFDEHGGTYDHVPPPWGATPPWGHGEPGHALEHGFKFDRFGVRVPTLFVSPYIERGTVIRSSTDVPFDHTSMIATVLTWMGVPRSAWTSLGHRVANAPTFEKVINRQTPRTDIPDIRLSPAHLEWLANPPEASKTPITPLQLKVLPLLLQHIHGGTLTPEKLDEVLARVLKGADTVDVLITRIEAEYTRSQAA
ncbi:MAG TPA: alkaline phosphatase family protein, partial [Hyalangium sp.]|nr:alkaline phosphatase family protein [Hyalangium sp.]